MKFRPVGNDSSEEGAKKQVVVAVVSKKKKQKQSHATATTAAAVAPEPHAVVATKPEAIKAVVTTATNIATGNNNNNSSVNVANKKKTSSTTAASAAVAVKTASTKTATKVDLPFMETTTTNAAVVVTAASSLEQVASKARKVTTAVAKPVPRAQHQDKTHVDQPPSIASTPAKTHSAYQQQLHGVKRDTTMFPADWWNIEYPSNAVPIPSRSVVEHYYQLALQNIDEGQGGAADASAASSVSTSNQAQLDEFGVGVLSFEDVLLPAVAHAEAEALRAFQSQVQRHYRKHPEPMEMDGVDDETKLDPSTTNDVGALVQECRRVLFNSTGAAVRAARESRTLREEQWALDEAEQATKRQQQKEQQRQEYERLRQLHKQQQRHELKMRLPLNQELWTESAFLLSGINKLGNEQRMWKEMERTLAQQEKEMDAQEAAWQQQKKEQQEQSNNTMVTKPQLKPNLLDEVQALDLKLAQLVEATTTSANGIHAALQEVNEFLTEADLVEQELNHKYITQHRLQGYKGASNPPGLIKILSQSQGD